MCWKQKRLYLGLIVSLFGVENTLQAYKITIKNNTSHKATFSIFYLKSPEASKYFCRSDEDKPVDSHRSTTIQSGGCIVGRINAKVYKNPEKPVKATSYIAPGGGIGLTWIIKKSGNNKFKVVKKQ